MNPLRRLLSTSVSKPTPFLSRSTCPYFNLAFEDWIFRNTPSETPLLLLYQNRPSVIVGRNQNPWKEINQDALKRLDIAFVRRRSGGGTVYHDLGNTNYSVMIPRTAFERRPNAELVARAVQKLGPPAEVNDRNDIVVEGFKVSGSAYKIVNKRAYHHGTMLIDAEMGRLGKVLHNTKANLVTKGVESVRSPVKNLRAWAPDITHDGFVEAVVNEFKTVYGGDENVREFDESIMDDEPGVKTIFDELQTWDWQYGQTPEFTHALMGTFEWGDVTARITSKHGRITESSLSYSPPLVGDLIPESAEDLCASLAEGMLGSKYGSLEDLNWASAGADASMGNDIIMWLRKDM